MATSSYWDPAGQNVVSQNLQFIQFLNSIVAQESGGDYSSVSPDGALGAYQIMPSSLAQWSQQVLGRRVSPQEFLSDHAMQDTIAQAILYGYWKKYGFAGAASAWYSGSPGNVNNNSPVNGGPSIAQYVQQVLARMPNEPTTLQTDNSGVSLGSSNLGLLAAPGADYNTTLAALRSQDPLTAALITGVPELNELFRKWLKTGGNEDSIISAIQNSHWYATHSQSWRQAYAQMTADPASWNETVTNLEASLKNFAAQLGVVLTANQTHQFAIDALQNGYQSDQAMLRQKFEQYVKPISGLHYGGEAGSTETTLRQAMMQLGTWLPEGTLDRSVQQITGGVSDTNSVIAQLRTQAAAKYPAYAQQINSGMNVSDIADPYIQQAQNLLEEGPGQMNIMSPQIQGALQWRDPSTGKPAALPLNEWENQVRSMPAWQQTNNARDSVMSTAHKVLQDFGFAF